MSAPEALSISYLIGSPPIGTSMSTLTSCGGFEPIGYCVHAHEFSPGNCALHYLLQTNTYGILADKREDSRFGAEWCGMMNTVVRLTHARFMASAIVGPRGFPHVVI
jgi:hypothetical protein